MVCGQASLAMKTLVINNQKGGVGKTMLAVHAAWFLAETGKRVLVVNLGPQANASYTLANARLAGCSATCFDPKVAAGAAPGVSLLAADERLH